jgi:regulator of nucleoside diphosphate kinase
MRAYDNVNTIEHRPVVLDAAHFGRLRLLASEPLHGAARLAAFLRREAADAAILPSHAMPANVVNFGSTVSYRDEATDSDYTVEVVMPHHADIRMRRVSVLTPVGTALIGRREGAVVTCEFPAGTHRRLAILRVERNAPARADAAPFVRRLSDQMRAAAFMASDAPA